MCQRYLTGPRLSRGFDPHSQDLFAECPCRTAVLERDGARRTPARPAGAAVVPHVLRGTSTGPLSCRSPSAASVALMCCRSRGRPGLAPRVATRSALDGSPWSCRAACGPPSLGPSRIGVPRLGPDTAITAGQRRFTPGTSLRAYARRVTKRQAWPRPDRALGRAGTRRVQLLRLRILRREIRVEWLRHGDAGHAQVVDLEPRTRAGSGGRASA